MRIDFVSPPFAGHLNPIRTLARAAEQAGHRVEIITEAGGVTEAQLKAIANTAEPVGSNPIRLLRQFRENLDLLPRIHAGLSERWQSNRPDLVVADSVAPVAGLVCTQRGIPWITTIATPFAIETRTATPSYCGGWTPGSPLRDAAGRTLIRTFKRSVGLLCRSRFAALGLRSLYRPDGHEAIYSPHAILGFGISELEFPRDWPPAFQMIGPVIDSPGIAPPIDYTAIPRPRVLISLGTHLLWAKRDLADQAEALAARHPGVSFVVSYGGAPAPPRPNHYTFVPYARDMAEFDAVIHHGGAGVTYAGILHAKPSCVIPHDYDQFDFAARIVHHQLGLRARSIAEAPIAQLLETRWPRLHTMQSAARAYRPAEAFLKTIDGIAAASRRA